MVEIDHTSTVVEDDLLLKGPKKARSSLLGEEEKQKLKKKEARINPVKEGTPLHRKLNPTQPVTVEPQKTFKPGKNAIFNTPDSAVQTTLPPPQPKTKTQ